MNALVYFQKGSNLAKHLHTQPEHLVNSIRRDFHDPQRFKSNSLIDFLWQICKKRKFARQVLKARVQIDKELDLQKFIHRLRLQVGTSIGLLTSR